MPWQTDLPEESPTPGRLSCKFRDVGSTLTQHRAHPQSHCGILERKQDTERWNGSCTTREPSLLRLTEVRNECPWTS
ncbi:hypothetical protein E2C01_073999 [Portunus trituberculatus]|uniref:Uncharacterized protein n=1 Tax=Portunus trituberculatus TaxID=210409 RepID=A0A5B7I4E5_PORTR|nr:hypothetical protein [Portunus trituberculatus]